MSRFAPRPRADIAERDEVLAARLGRAGGIAVPQHLEEPRSQRTRSDEILIGFYEHLARRRANPGIVELGEVRPRKAQAHALEDVQPRDPERLGIIGRVEKGEKLLGRTEGLELIERAHVGSSLTIEGRFKVLRASRTYELQGGAAAFALDAASQFEHVTIAERRLGA